VCTEASTVLRAVTVDFFFNCSCLEIPLDNSNRASTIMRKAFDWKHSRISMLEVEAILQSSIP
jgi:hypothetical protein